jgi:hypothetical protein
VGPTALKQARVQKSTMRTRKNPGAVVALGASVSSDQLARRVTSEANRQQSVTQARILVTLVGADRCSGEGVTAECSSASSGYHRSLVPAPPDPLAGTTVRLPNRCRCGRRATRRLALLRELPVAPRLAIRQRARVHRRDRQPIRPADHPGNDPARSWIQRAAETIGG